MFNFIVWYLAIGVLTMLVTCGERFVMIVLMDDIEYERFKKSFKNYHGTCRIRMFIDIFLWPITWLYKIFMLFFEC